MGSALRNSLKRFCCAHGWSYAIFWRFHPLNSLLLTVEDAYYEGQLGQEIANMLPQVHFLGEGVVGQAAFTGKPRWMLSDAQTQEWNLTGAFGGGGHCEYDSELRQQFSSGIKTIAVISVKPWGVVQFGSTQKILEREEFLEQTQRLLIGTEHVDMLDASATTVIPWDCENYDLNGLLGSENLSYWNLNSDDGDNSKELLRNAYFCASVDNSFPCTSKMQEEGMTGLHGESYCLTEQLTAASEAQIVLSDRAGFDVFLEPNPCFETWSGEVSCLGSSRAQDVTVEHSTLNSSVDFPEDLSKLDGLSSMVWEDLSELCSVDDLCQWFAPSPVHSISATITALDDSHSQSIEFGDPVTNALMHTCQKSMLHSVGLDFAGDRRGNNVIAPTVKAASSSSESISDLNTGTKKGLFSELGIEELLKGGSSSEEQISTAKRRRTDYSPVNTNPVSSNLDNTNNLVNRNEIHHSHCINGQRTVPQKPEEPTKTSRKRARPGESTRPRPKDRQQIQDRIKELRGIIPSGAKCSIDSLLDRTIKYMLFLQSITKYADKLQEPKNPKLIDEANGVGEPDSEDGGGGVTWAFEVAGQTMVCPIIVEDMSCPGQMLIEMLCEEQGLFLEITEIIRGFGLNILKGNMEIRENKLWGRFIVEAKRHVTRIDVFWYLVQLLQQTNTPGTGMDNYHKQDMPLPVMGMAE